MYSVHRERDDEAGAGLRVRAPHSLSLSLIYYTPVGTGSRATRDEPAARNYLHETVSTDVLTLCNKYDNRVGLE